MNPIALGLDVFVAALLIAALVMGARLNGRLKTLREGQAHFVRAVADLDQAAARAQSGLADLRAASESAHDELLNRIETARALAQKLERLNQDAERTLSAAPPPSLPTSGAGRAMAAVAALAQRASAQRPVTPGRGDAPSPLPSSSRRDPRAEASRQASRPAPRSGPGFDDELFEPDADLGPLRRKDDRR